MDTTTSRRQLTLATTLAALVGAFAATLLCHHYSNRKQQKAEREILILNTQNYRSQRYLIEHDSHRAIVNSELLFQINLAELNSRFASDHSGRGEIREQLVKVVEWRKQYETLKLSPQLDQEIKNTEALLR